MIYKTDFMIVDFPALVTLEWSLPSVPATCVSANDKIERWRSRTGHTCKAFPLFAFLSGGVSIDDL